MILIGIVGVAVGAWAIAWAWRNEQRTRAMLRAWDRIEQEEHPEIWARKQVRQAQIDALVDAELADMRRARWYSRLLGWTTFRN